MQKIKHICYSIYWVENMTFSFEKISLYSIFFMVKYIKMVLNEFDLVNLVLGL